MERVVTEPDAIPLRAPVKLNDGRVVTQIIVNPGQVVLIPIISIQRMESVWKDSEAFRPERWLEDLPSKEKLCAGWSNTLAFSDGPRNCIGFRLGMYCLVGVFLLLSLNFILLESYISVQGNISEDYHVYSERPQADCIDF
jgi:cytochrome P450